MKYLYFLFCLVGTIAAFGQTSWVQKGGPLGGEVDDVEYYPGTSIVWALVNGRVHKSVDDGVTWTAPSNSIFANNTIYDIEISNNTIYFLAYDALYASSDQGASLTTLSDGLFSNGLKIKRLPVSGGLVVLSGNGSPDIYYSTNNGTTWTAGYNTTSLNLGYLAVNAVDQVFILVNVGAGVYRPYRSTDNGATFSEFSTGITAGLNAQSLSTNVAGNVYCVTLTDIHALSGSTWTSIKGGQITDVTIASVSTNGSFMNFTADGLGAYFIDNLNHKLYTKAVSDPPSGWINQATNFPNTPNGTIWPSLPVYTASSRNYPAASSNIVFGTLSGIYRSATGGATTPESNTGIAKLSPDKTIATSDGTLLMKTFSVGVLRSVNSGDTWSRVTSLPISMSDIVNVVTGTVPSDGTTQLGLSSTLSLYQSSDDGGTFNSITTPITFFDIYGGDNNRAFGRSGASVYYSSTGGTSWSAAPIALGLPGGVSVNDFYVPTSTSVVYAYVNNAGTNQFYKITMTYGGTNTASGSAALMASPPFAPGTVYASNGKLYVYNSSTDLVTVFNGTSWSAARSVANGRFFVASNNGYLFATESGNPNKIYMSKDDAVTFTSTDLPDGIFPSNISDVTVSPQDFVFLSIFSNYIYQSKTKVVAPAAPTALTEVARLGNVYSFKWTDNAYNETAYRIMRSSDGGTTYSVIGTVDSGDICTTTTLGGFGFFADNTVVPGTSYKYKVKAVNEAGETESAVLTPGGAIPALSLPTIPDNRSWSAQNTGGTGFSVQAPKIVSIQSQGNGRYKVSDIVENAFGSQNVPQDFYVNGTTSVVGNATTIGSFYQVKPNGTNTWTSGTNTLKLSWLRCDDPTKTETVTFTLQATDPAPVAPVLQAVITTSSQVELSWNTVDYGANYIVERSTTSSSTGFSQIGTNVAYPTSITTDNTVAIGTTYYYRVKARNANASPQDSPYSNVVTVQFQKPNFSVSATTVSSYIATTVGSYWADFDNDGNEDLLTVNGTLDGVGIATVTIFRNLGTGDFEVKPVATDANAYNFGAVADIDGDGKMDFSVAIASTAQVDFYKGNGDFTFTKFTPAQLGDLASVVKGEREGIMWGDINNDGLLDVIMSGNYDPLLDDRISVCIQNGDHTFTSIHAGDLSDLTVNSFSTFWIDYNNDGYVDVLVSGGGVALRLYKNNGDKTFKLLTPGESGINVSGILGMTVADFNNDGFMDIYAGSAGSQQSVIYQNNGDGTFALKNTTPVTEAAFVVSPAAGDINNDGLVDLIVPGFFAVPTKIFMNTGSGSVINFSAITTEKINDANYWHVGTAFADYDKNGFLDVALGSLKNINNSDDQFVGGENYLYKNNNNTGNWTQIKLVGVTANKNGLGARITVVAGGKTYIRDVTNSSSFTSLNSLTQHFGLGAAGSITSITVKWPTSPVASQVLTNQTVNTIITITQDTYPPTVTAQTPAPGATGVAIATMVDVTFSEASTAVAGKKLNITKTGDGSPTFSIDVATAAVSGNKFTFTLPSALVENTHYDVTIEAGAFVDQFQNGIVAVSGWGFTTTNVDAIAPVFGVQTGLPTEFDKVSGANASIGIPITDNKAVTAASIFVKGISESTYTELTGSAGAAPTWNFSIPPGEFDGMGLQYYFTAKDAAGNTTRSPVTGANKITMKYTQTEAQIPAVLVGSGGTATGWKVIAVPFDLGSNNGVQVVFDELTNATPALTVKVDYRILTYTESPSPAWQDYPTGFSTVDRGAGYFINVKSPVTLVVGAGLSAPDNARDHLFQMNLKAGWNMIGNPYLEKINWDNVKALNSLTGTNATTFKRFSGGSYSNGTTIAAYEGGFVHADAATTISIPFDGQITNGRMQQITFGDNEWLVPISLKQREINNDFGGIGMHTKALLSYDELDDINGPRWFEFTEMNFSHPETMVKNFARDVVPVSDEFVWSFTVDSNLPDVATLNWDNSSYVIANDLYLYDVATQTPINMKERSSYSFNSRTSSSFKVFYGANVLAQIKPAKLMLGVPYPNPTAGTSTVQFSIPEKDGANAISVSLDVFDMTGRKVSTIANGQFAPGFYNGQWEANEALGNGMYFYRLMAGNEVVTSKVILRK